MLNWLQSIAYLIYGFALLRAALMAQGAALHQQFIVLADEHKSTSFNPHRSIVIDSTLWITPRIFEYYPHIVQPETIIHWRCMGFRVLWRWNMRLRGGRPKVSQEIRYFIRKMSLANHLRGTPRTHGRMLKRVIGSIRRECLDQIIILNAMHLHRVLKAYTKY